MRRNRSAALAATVLLLGVPAITSATVTPAAADPDPPLTHDDFNADRYPDLVVSAPNATVDGQKNAGYITVMYGSAKGYSKANSLVISQATPGVPGAPEAGDGFGTAVTSVDLDQNGYPELLVGVPGEDLGSMVDAGAVTIFWNYKKGFDPSNGMVWEEQSPAAGRAMGSALAAGNFFGDPVNQLVALTRDDIAVYEIYIGDDGAVLAPPKPKKMLKWPGGGKPTGLAAGDFDRDRYDDLVLLGTATKSGRKVPWGWYRPGGPHGLGTGVSFPAGTVAATGDVDHDGFDDLVSSYPDQLDASGQDTTGGTVHVFYGGLNGLDDTDTAQQDRFTQDSEGVRGTGEPLDRWGSDLSVGDVDGDGYDDVAIGARGEDVEAVKDAGALWLLRGSPEGVTATGSQLFHQDSPDIPGSAEAGDEWGAQVKLADPDVNGNADLVAAAPGEDAGEGAVWVLNGTQSGLTATGSWTFSGTSLGIPSAGARFGAALSD